MAYTTFLAFGGFLGTRETDKESIDDIPFQLQYKVTTALLFLSCALVSAAELVGKHTVQYEQNKKLRFF